MPSTRQLNHQQQPQAGPRLAPNDRPEYCTAGVDGTARVWDASGEHRQLYEFRVAGDGAASAVTYHPIRYELALGFDSGRVRIFDVATARLLQEARPHRGAIKGLVFGPEGARLVTWSADGSVAVLNATKVRDGLGVHD
jgi:WD40 repeat protein